MSSSSTISLTKYEKARIVGERAGQISRGAPLNLTEEERGGVIDSIELAEEEFKRNRIPIIIHRPLPSGMIEEVRLMK